MLNLEVKKYIESSVLCWLATSDIDNFPNVSPKEMFTYYDEDTIIIANIASPKSIENIRLNPKVCLSFIDIFVQKGFKLKGIAKIIEKNDETFIEKSKKLIDLFTEEYKIISIIDIKIKKVEQIKAPSYYLYPDITEEIQIKNTMKTYKVIKSDKF